MSWGAGYREQPTGAPGLLGLQLYRRLDGALVGPAERPDPWEQVEPFLDALGLHDLQADSNGRLRVAVPGVAELVELGGHAEHDLDELPGVLLRRFDLDLHAVLGVVAERQHDPRGLAWPRAVAPFELALLPVGPQAAGLADKLHAELIREGYDVLLDDLGQPPAQARERLLAWGLPWIALVGAGADPSEVVLEERATPGTRRLPAAGLATLLGAGPGPSVARRRRRWA